MNERAVPVPQTSRRQFLKSSSAAALGGLVTAHLSSPKTSFAANSDTIRVGLIGCGGRGTGAASQALRADPNVVLTAMGDAFSEQLHRSLSVLKRENPERVQVEADRTFVGLDAYEKVLNSGVDAVLLATPPGFRPLHFQAAVAAGKHIFCEKPVATDSPGVRTVLAAAAEAKRKKLAVVSGFCWRYNYPRREFYKRIHDGAIGDIRAIYATYYTGPVKPMPPADTRPPGATDVEWQLRNWYNFVWLCGDGLVEQAVHSVDKIAWAMGDTPPLKAVAVGGRQIPNNQGNIYDHFEINYEYPNGTRAFMGCRQITGCYNQNADYILGTNGTGLVGVRPTREVEIEGPNAWHYRGPKNDMYQTEHDELFASIRKGEPLNDGVWMCHSTLLAIMGRIAAYTGQEITWEQALNSQENLFPDNLSWTMNLPIPPMAMPGRTKYV